MDPSVWGPKMWSLMYDICYRASLMSLENETNKTHYQRIESFLLHIKNILPCIYCRLSYAKHAKHVEDFKTMDANPSRSFSNSLKKIKKDKLVPKKGDLNRQEDVAVCHPYYDPDNPPRDLVHWVHSIKEKVNDHLERDSRCHLSECLFRKKLKVYTSCCSADDVWDLLCILACNFENHSDVNQRHVFYHLFFSELGIVLQHGPHLHFLGIVLQAQPIQPFYEMNEWIEYVLKARNEYTNAFSCQYRGKMFDIPDDYPKTIKDIKKQYGCCQVFPNEIKETI
jgi:hypothetical protein